MRIRAKLAAAAVLAVAVLMLIPGIASAHAERSVGPFDLEIGFGTNPRLRRRPEHRVPRSLEQGR